jgi:hypothetical protein
MTLDIIFYRKFYAEFENFNNEELTNHYYKYGIIEKRISSLKFFYEMFPFFSLENYKIFNPDLNSLKSDIEYFKHFYFSGQFENRKCNNSEFDLLFYKTFNRDLNYTDDKEYINHYLKNGINENRMKCKDDFYKLFPKYKDLKDINQMYSYFNKDNKTPINLLEKYPTFDVDFYKLFNKDIIYNKKEDLIKHFINHGIKENRLICKDNFYKLYPDFDADIYKYYNNDLKNQDEINLMYHFHNSGKNERRSYKFIDNSDFFNIEICKKFQNYSSEMDNKAIFKDYIKNKEKYIGNLTDFYKNYPDFNIDIYKNFYYIKTISENDIITNILNEVLDSIDNNNKSQINNLDNNELIYHFYINDKTNVIYSLKTFYLKYPKFDYYLYVCKKNITNIGEVNTIINWYLNDFNYDFIDSNEDPLKYKFKNILIYPYYEYSNNCGGIVVQYYLAQILDKIGVKVRIKLNNNYIPNNIYNNYDNNDFELKDTIVIYGETIKGNPLNAPNIIRWILAELGIISGKHIYKTWGLNDLVYYFNSELKFLKEPDKLNNIYKNLSLLYIDPIFKNINQERYGYCHTFRKTEFHKNISLIHPQNSFEITREHKQEDYFHLFNKYEYFVSYDPLTFLSIIAAICGCISIIYPIEGISKKDWLKMTALADYLNDKNLESIYGIAYGYSFKEISNAYSTLPLVKDQWDDIHQYFKEKYIYPFIKDINNLSDCKNTIQNNFYI